MLHSLHLPLRHPLAPPDPPINHSGDHGRISNLITTLANDFVRSSNTNHRKGGLIGLAATSIGLLDSIDRHLPLLLPPVLRCFEDYDSRVRYYACESMYNIAKVARGNVLASFNQIFDGLCKLQADVNVDVNNGAQLLDRLIKDIVAESESFDVEKFIPLLRKYIDMINPYIRQLLIGWIQVLDSVPDIDMLDWLPTFLDGLFNMLSDSNPDIRTAAAETLAVHSAWSRSKDADDRFPYLASTTARIAALWFQHGNLTSSPPM